MKTIVVNMDGENYNINFNELEFNNGLAIYTIKKKHWRYNEEIVYKGVVDESGVIVLPHQAYYMNIDIFPGKSLIVKVRKGNDSGTVTWTETRHYKYNGFRMEMVNDKISSSYEKVSDTVIKTSTVDECGKRSQVLYDVVIAQIISEYFTKICNFETRPNGEELACATTTLEVGESSYDMDCYINKSGVIRTPIYNSYENSIMIFDTRSAYKEALEKIYNEIKTKEGKKSKEKEKVMKTFWDIKM